MNKDLLFLSILKQYPSIWARPQRSLLRPPGLAGSRPAHSRRTGCSPAGRRPADWAPVCRPHGLTSRTAAGRRPPGSAAGRMGRRGRDDNLDGDAGRHLAECACQSVSLTVALCCFMTASGGPSASKRPFLIRPTWEERSERSSSGIVRTGRQKFFLQ